MRRLILLACALPCFGSPAYADPSVSDYRTAVGAERQALDLYVSATSHAYLWANAAAEAEGRPPLYCVPPRLALTGDQVSVILDRWLEERPVSQTPEDSFLAFEVLLALKHTFPCPEADVRM